MKTIQRKTSNERRFSYRFLLGSLESMLLLVLFLRFINLVIDFSDFYEQFYYVTFVSPRKFDETN